MTLLSTVCLVEVLPVDVTAEGKAVSCNNCKLLSGLIDHYYQDNTV